MSSPGKAVVLLSGGLDSAICLALAKNSGFEPCALTLQYGQRHLTEIQASRDVALRQQVQKHLILNVDLGAMGGSALTSSEFSVPKTGLGAGIPVTYVPARNTIFLALALGWAESLGAQDIFIGVNAVDYSGYPDCRPAFIDAFERLANLATREGVTGHAFRIHAPLLHLSKVAIIQKGLDLGVDLSVTRSCYDPDLEGRGCRLCDACRLRLKAFQEAGVPDPAPYQALAASCQP
ncbi:MAG: 7-cyano-7-deazaguanine synthase QueC [Magnetococcus sp. DMHC-1]|nr:7-cyano-7-deazaguanine synthase QueC [Magnetococcales bacterium]MBF0155052.1 7-cyano-7-deazaguanine synthase QueC [Magnetococcales bacterium]